LCQAQGYDTVGIIAEAVKNSVFDSDIRKGLYKISNYPGVTGNISINSERNAIKTIFIKEIVKLETGGYGPEFVTAIEPDDAVK
jgi:ABC-type branched-subunit amino acid transport system substrate-binding protein